MCGRFATLLPNDAMAQLFDAAPDNDLPEGPNFNVCPTTQIGVVVSGDRRRLVAMRWGFIPSWYKAQNGGPLLINARSETIAEKPAFRDACRTRRCLIPMRGFYEWTRKEGEKPKPWYIFRADGTPLVCAGIHQSWGQGEDTVSTVAMVTCAANDPMSKIHHRMPVVIEEGDWALWLGETAGKAAPLMTQAGADVLDWFRVSDAVNSNRATGAELVQPVKERSEINRAETVSSREE